MLRTRQEQANSREALIMVWELLRCRLAEGGHEALLERVAKLIYAACEGAAPICTLSTSQAMSGALAGPHNTRMPFLGGGGGRRTSRWQPGP